MLVLNLIVKIAAAIAAVALPVMYLIEWKYRIGKKARLIHGVCAAVGVLSLGAVYLAFFINVKSAAGDVRGWAEDFFYPHFVRTVIFDAVLTGLLCIAAAIDHKMRRIRLAVAALLPVALILVTVFTEYIATGGYFPVDFYIGATAPGLGLLPHAAMLCERKKKSR